MRNFNPVAILIFVLFFFNSCSNEEDFITSIDSISLDDISNVEIYDVAQQKEVIVTTDYLKTKWETSLMEEGVNVKLENFRIIESLDKETGAKVFFLLTSSKDKTIETGAFLTKTDNGSYRLGSKQCTCTGCPNGCNITVVGSTCSCSGCGDDTSKKCTKSETVIIQE